MPHNALTDEQILVLRLAGSQTVKLGAMPSAPSDIETLRELGYLELVDGVLRLTQLGANALAGVDEAWATHARRRTAI